MNLEERKRIAKQQFNKLEVLRNDHLKQAEDCLTEMNRLQGEYRLLDNLIAEEKAAEMEDEEAKKKVKEPKTEEGKK